MNPRLLLGISCFVLSGFFLPWWGAALAGVLFGALMAFEGRIHRLAFLCGASLWMIPALVKDIESHGHISLAVAGLAGLQWRPIAYLIIGLIGGMLASAGSLLGSNGHLIFARIPVVEPLREEDKPAD